MCYVITHAVRLGGRNRGQDWQDCAALQLAGLRRYQCHNIGLMRKYAVSAIIIIMVRGVGCIR